MFRFPPPQQMKRRGPAPDPESGDSESGRFLRQLPLLIWILAMIVLYASLMAGFWRNVAVVR